MEHNPDELKKAMELAQANFINLPLETRRSIASPFDRIHENEIAISLAEKHLAKMKKRREELRDWLMEWYRNNKE